MNRNHRVSQHGQATVFALLVTVVMLGLLGYWFVVAERARVFLYDHLGATPFDAVTSSRYWMAGFVAGGYLCLVLIVITLVGLSRGRCWLPAPGRVMGIAAGPLAVGAIVETGLLGAPRLPFALAALVALTTLIGAYLALWAASTIQQRCRSSLWLILDGMGLVPLLTLTQVLELPGRGTGISPRIAWGIVGASVACGIVWRGVMAWVYRHAGAAPAPAWDVVRAGVTLSYVALPTLHHLIATPPGYKYITTADNFMARNPWLLMATWTAVLVIALGAERVKVNQAIRRS